MKKLRVLVLMHHYQVPPDDVSGHDVTTAPWRTEYDVLKTLRDEGLVSSVPGRGTYVRE